jgi:uncharacterized protein YbbK (DUF523 family)
MIVKQLDSSALAEARFDEATSDMTIVFVDGAEHTYPEMDRDVFVALVEAKSPGRFFNLNIRGKFGQ